jgi:hypothetical protein
MKWMFWNVDFSALDLERDATTILGVILERGRLDDVRWALQYYGRGRIRQFFQRGGHPELSERTRRFWRVFFSAAEESWAEPPGWRRHSSDLWND